MKKIITSFVATISIITLSLISAVPAFATTSTDEAQSGLNELKQGQNNISSGNASFGNILQDIVTILSFVAGILAVFFVILAGFKYITSGGDSNKVAGAKNTLIYALVGIAVAVLGQILVHFVISSAFNATNGK